MCNASSKRCQPYPPCTFGGTSQQNTTQTNRCPRLTSSERELLSAHRGCFKCCRFYQSHSGPNCPNGFPAGENYRTCTLDDAVRTQRNSTGRTLEKGKQSFTPSKPMAKAVTSTHVAQDENTSSEDINKQGIYTMLGPKITNAVLGNGSFSEEDSVSAPPLKSKHFIWKCTTDSPAVEFPVTVSALIDNGAHLVLIRPELVTKLGLPIFKLKEPETVDVAIDLGNQKKIPQILTH